MKMRTRALAIVLALGLTASPAYGAATHDEYVSEVNPICADLKRDAKKIRVRPSGDEFADSLRELSIFNKLLGKAVRRIDSVEPPPEDAQAVKDWLAAVRRQRRQGDRYVAAVKRGQVRPARVALKQATRAAASNGKQAKRLGLNKCA